MSTLYQNELIRIRVEDSEIPWLIIFTQHPYKEMSDCDKKPEIRKTQT